MEAIKHASRGVTLFARMMISALPWLISSAVHAQTPVGNAFTYQGRFKQNGVLVNGRADFRFRLFDAELNGTQLASVVVLADQLDLNANNVDRGLFNASVNFGANKFDGNARWVEVAIRFPSNPAAGNSGFAAVTPRQVLAPAPYSISGGGWFPFNGSTCFTGLRVGIGTTSPTANLHVQATGNGECRFNATQYCDLVLNSGAGSNSAFIFENANVDQWELLMSGSGTNFGVYDGLLNTYRMIFDHSGRVGIGTVDPTSTLHVYGPAIDSNFANSPMRVSDSGGSLLIDGDEITRANGQTLYLQTNGNNLVLGPFGGSKVGVGTQTLTYLFNVNGSAGKPGGGSWSDFSDARLKKNIQPLDHALERLLDLRGITFEWIDPSEHGNLTGTQIGMIAQEVEPHFPQWIGQSDNGFKTLGFKGFEALTVEALRDLRDEKDRQIENLKSTIQQQQEMIRNLANRLEAIESQLQKDYK